MAPVYLIGVLLNPLKQALSLFLSHLTGLGLGLLRRLRLLFFGRSFGGRIFTRVLIGILLLVLFTLVLSFVLWLLVLFPVLILFLFVLLALLPILRPFLLFLLPLSMVFGRDYL